jgi:5-oxoprolinase (ATP-hydrolysing) subunit A
VPTIDLNADVGEGGGDGVGGDDEAVLDVVTSAGVACGVHAGDPGTMRRTVEAAVRRGVVVGAHPSYPDRAGFGRRPMDLPPARVTEEIVRQVGALDVVARACGTEVRFVKPHGALYHHMAEDKACAMAVAEAVAQLGGLVLLAPAGSGAVEVGRGAGARVATEAFADRAYEADGRLTPRAVPGAVLVDPDAVVRQAIGIVVGHRVTAVDGTPVELTASSLCVHGDTPGAAALAARVRRALEGAGVTLASFVP